jgi:hypothetical protein
MLEGQFIGIRQIVYFSGPRVASGWPDSGNTENRANSDMRKVQTFHGHVFQELKISAN